jgi:hypothetical protein
MVPEDMKKTALVTKTGLYDWTVMPFGLKNAISTFTRTMSLVFKELGGEFLKVFAAPLFELTKKEVAFVWDLGCQSAFEALKGALVAAPVLIQPDFDKQFCLDVDWSPKGVGAILSQKEDRKERVVAYASKGLTFAQKKFHPMEGECYALIWGVMRFRQYLHRTHFILRTDHKPLSGWRQYLTHMEEGDVGSTCSKISVSKFCIDQV